MYVLRSASVPSLVLAASEVTNEMYIDHSRFVLK